MRVFESTAHYKKNKTRPLVLALGNFDGIHRGHRRLLDYVLEQSQKLGGQPAVFTFQEHPQHILHPEHAPDNLRSREQKVGFLKSLGMEVCFLQKFDRRFAALSAEKFVEKILVKRLGIREICLGYNARFGKGRQGDADLLRQLGKKFNFHVFQAEPVVWQGCPVSSTAVREAIRHGRMDLATGLLGRPWSLQGEVVRGEARGRELGFPTANIRLKNFVRPQFGVYAVHVRLADSKKIWKGAANIGIRPSFARDREPLAEVHLFGFQGNLYGKKAEVFLLKHLRKEKKFKNAEALCCQIKKDILAARRILKS